MTCKRCEGDGYTETFNDDQSGVVITPCPDCSPSFGERGSCLKDPDYVCDGTCSECDAA